MSLGNGLPDNSKITKRDPFKFTDQVRAAAWARQEGVCGICGCDLRKQSIGEGEDYADTRVEAHHIISCQATKLRAKVESVVGFVLTVDNCMYLCGECHQHRAHGGNYGGGGLRPPYLFRHSHGKELGQSRLEWIARANAQWIQLFGDCPELKES